MRVPYKIAVFAVLAALAGCSQRATFSGYRMEELPVTRVTESRAKTVQVLNDSDTRVQHVMSVAFYGGSNKNGHFQVVSAMVGNDKVGLKDIFVPPLGVLNLEIAYAPLNLETTEASWNGWTTTSEDRWPAVDLNELELEPEPEDEAEDKAGDEAKGAVATMARLADGKGESEYEPAIHRAMLIVAYDEPDDGYMHIELAGGAVPGPNGETTSEAIGPAGGGADCVAEGTTACFSGTFSIDIPGLMSGGALEVDMIGSIPFTINDTAVELDMNLFPPILITLVGNGPGEPLEGKPVDAVSIVISGTPDVLAAGSFDGQSLTLAEVSFRVRVILGKITYDDINPGLAAAVDFNIEGLNIETEEPFNGESIVFGVETTLSATPSGNGLFDAFLGNAQVAVKFSGALDLP